MIEVRKLGGPLGAEITGLDPRLPVSAADLQIVEQAFLDNLVLRFRGAPLTTMQLRDFGRCFGELRAHVAKDYRHPEFPEVVMMTNQDKDGHYDQVGAERGVGWHSDGTFEAVPPKATILHAIAVPDSGGNTVFANMYLAYATMPADLKRRVEGKLARFRLRGRKHQTQGIVAAEDLKKMTDVIHPLIRVHPDTGRKSVFVNPHHTLSIEGMSREASDVLLDELFEWCGRREFQWEQQWQANDTILWENRSAWHSGRSDYPKNQLRQFIRTTICERDPATRAAAAH